MEKNKNGKYILENHLRTWSEFRKEREEHVQSLQNKSSSTFPVPERKRWGGCRGSYNKGHSRPHIKQGSSTEHDVFYEEKSEHGKVIVSSAHGQSNATEDTSSHYGAEGHRGLQQRLEDFLNTSPKSKSSEDSQDQTPLVRSADRLSVLRGGRDGGGSLSGANSQAGSSDEDDTEEQVEHEVKVQDPSPKAQERSRLRARADALGDQSDTDPDPNENQTNGDGKDR